MVNSDVLGHPRAVGPWWQRVPRSAVVVWLAGIAHGLSFAPAYAWWLQIVSLACLAWATMQAQPRRAAGLGSLFGLGWLMSGFWWLYISMNHFGGLPAWMAAAAVLLLAAALSLYYAMALGIWARFLRPVPAGGGALVWWAFSWSACWLLAELARATFLTGFPWIASGYAHSSGPLVVWAPWVGVYGLSALAAFLACALACGGLPGVPWVARACPSVVAGLLLVLGAWLPNEFTQSTGALRVSLVQPNVAQNLKFDPARIDANLRALIEQIHGARGQFVMTPESVVPLSRHDLNPEDWAALRAPFSQSDRGALMGVFLGNDAEGYVNSLVGLNKSGEGYHYGKRHLLPFGEVIPPGFGWFVRMMGIPLADQAHGKSTAPFELAGQRIRPLICFEDLFGEDMVDSLVGPQAATVLANGSNLAWFGRWLVQDQHLQFSQLRAMEFQRPVVRATNTGSTAVIDHRGVVVARLTPWQPGVLEAEVDGRIGETPYARWLSRWGLWPLWVCGLGPLLLARWLPARWRGRKG